MLSLKYVRLLQDAAQSREVVEFVANSLSRTLTDIGLSAGCTSEIVSLIADPGSPRISGPMWVKAVASLVHKWERHLDRVYTFSYERERRELFRTHVFPEL